MLINSPTNATHHNLRIDNRGGVMLIVRHLLASGRRSIVHLAGFAGNLDAAERGRCLSRGNGDVVPDLPVRIVEGDFTEEIADRLVQQLLAEGTEFDAIFAANDMMALGALLALRTVGNGVPGQVAVAGFDDVPMARYLGLSTVRVDMAGVGELAVRRLIDQLEGSTEPPALVRQSPTLVARTTIGR